MKSFIHQVVRRVMLAVLAVAAGGHLGAQTLTTLGSVAPNPGAGDISQLAAGNTTRPDGLNYYTDNSAPAGQTFTTGSSPMNLVSLSVKTAVPFVWTDPDTGDSPQRFYRIKFGPE